MLSPTRFITLSFLVFHSLSVEGTLWLFEHARLRINSIWSNTLFAAQSDEGTTIDMLDAMQQLLTGDAEYFDPAFLEELLQVGSVENGV